MNGGKSHRTCCGEEVERFVEKVSEDESQGAPHPPSTPREGPGHEQLGRFPAVVSLPEQGKSDYMGRHKGLEPPRRILRDGRGEGKLTQHLTFHEELLDAKRCAKDFS